LTVCLQKRQEE